VSGALWITGPDSQWVAEDHVLGLADYLHRLGRDMDAVSRRLPISYRQSDSGNLEFAATVSWGEVSKIQRDLENLSREVGDLQSALLHYAASTGDQERARVRTFQAPADRLFALMVISFSGNPPPADYEQWGFAEAAGSFMPEGRYSSDVRVWLSSQTEAIKPPQSLADRLARIPHADQAPIRIERYATRNGEGITEVFIAGTRHLGAGDTSEAFDMASNIALVAGVTAASMVAVERAMKNAGVTSTDKVTFVGHSQGGLIATRLAESGRYQTAGLVTVGAPVGVAPVRGSYPAVHIVHSDDVVPSLGGHAAPTRAVRIETHSGAPVGGAIEAHSLAAYTRTAMVADSSPAAHRFGSLPQGTGSTSAQFFSARRE